jgi:quercetin dioxygenase-like cupin family protein
MIGSASTTSLVRADEIKWETTQPCAGVDRCILRDGKGGESVLLRFKAGATIPFHPHPGGEHLFVVHGRIRISEKHLGPGDYLWTPQDVSTDAEAQEETLLLLVLPK